MTADAAHKDLLELLPAGLPVVLDLGAGRRRGSAYQGPIRDPGRAAPRWVATARRWIAAVAAELERSGIDRAVSRGRALSECTRYSRGRICRSCGHPHPGKLGTSHVRCHARSCPRCGPWRAYQIRDRVRAWLESQSAPRGDWWHVVLTRAYDPGDAAVITPEALRGRIATVRRDWRSTWRDLRAAGASAALVGVECGRWGAVHLHAVVSGPRPRIRDLPDGTVWVSEDPLDDVPRVVGEICKYSAKVPGDSSWWREPTLVPSPQLAAAWEIATWGARLLERYGAARQLPPQPPEEKEVDDQIQCDRCGATVEECAIPTGIWVRLCETAGVQPFGRASPNGRRGMTRISCATCGEPVDPATAHWDRDRGTICLACWRAIVTPVHVATRRLTAEERQITLDEWITGKGKVNGQKKKDRK